MKRVKLINDPAELVALFRAVDSEIRRNVLSTLAEGWTMISDLINKYGEAYYIKIDIEHMDYKILALILSSDIFPPFISVESHSLKVLSLLSSKYSSFKVENGLDVGRYIKRTQIYSTKLGKYITYSFPKHSAGPFGDDIKGEWVSETRFIRKLAIEGLGWVDIHCSRNQKSHFDTMTGREFLLKSFIGFLRNSVLQARPFRYFSF